MDAFRYRRIPDKIRVQAHAPRPEPPKRMRAPAPAVAPPAPAAVRHRPPHSTKDAISAIRAVNIHGGVVTRSAHAMVSQNNHNHKILKAAIVDKLGRKIGRMR